MKKSRLFFVLILAFAVLLLAGCKEDKKVDNITAVSLKGYNSDSVIEIPIGVFDCSAYTLVATYASGNTEEITLTPEMISDTDMFKIYQMGEHDITVTYAKQKCVFKISVKRSTFGNLSFPENSVFTYDGKAHTVEIEGAIPANAVITYQGGNSFVNAGTYNVTAIVSCDGYVTEKISTTVTIERAKYDMSGVKFEAKEFVYDGAPHSVEISGVLPEGVSKPTYIINEKATSSATNVGEYEVIARFANGNPNYEAIPDMKTTLKITQAEHNIKGLDLVFKNEEGNVINDLRKAYDGKDVSFDLNDYAKLPKKATVSFTVSDENGNLVSNSNKITNIKNAGVYTVTVEFKLADSKNYKAIDPIVRKFEVVKVDHPPIDVHFDSDSCVYDGLQHSIKIEGILPDDITVSYEYYLGGELVVDAENNPVESVSNAGRYTVKAVFTHSDPNTKDIQPLSATLQITQASLDSSKFEFTVNGGSVYDGAPKSLAVKGTLPEGVEARFEYYLDGKLVSTDGGATPASSVTNVGEYEVRVIFTATNSNYVDINMVETSLVIEKAEVSVSGVTINGQDSYTYDGSAKRPTITGVPENVNVKETLYKVDMYGSRSEVSSAVECGKYVITFELIHKDDKNYGITGEVLKEKVFVINQQIIDISGVKLEGASFVYNGSDQRPTLVGVPEQYVSYAMTIYSGSNSIEYATNVGTYRCEVILSVNNSNYKLSSNAKISIDYEITPKEINVDSLTFDKTEFDYNMGSQAPSLVNLPEHVKPTVKVYLLGGTEPIDGAVNVGKYRCEVRLAAEGGNYKLKGTTSYYIDFEIKKKVIDLSEIFAEELVFIYNNGDHKDSPFNIEVEGSGRLCDYMTYVHESFYTELNTYCEPGSNEWHSITWFYMSNVGRYRLTYTVRVKEPNNCILKYNSNEYTSVTIQVKFQIVTGG